MPSSNQTNNIFIPVLLPSNTRPDFNDTTIYIIIKFYSQRISIHQDPILVEGAISASLTSNADYWPLLLPTSRFRSPKISEAIVLASRHPVCLLFLFIQGPSFSSKDTLYIFFYHRPCLGGRLWNAHTNNKVRYPTLCTQRHCLRFGRITFASAAPLSAAAFSAAALATAFSASAFGVLQDSANIVSFKTYALLPTIPIKF